ncbi:amidohydrolase [Pseudarthrobacter sulfonivorans]|uniref:Amidohydrolase n=1 Tax=Pseudarthrobacter sulfonivorans TaxID=121292 RepID=A0A0U3QVH4_9MICC|nr:amidohydrolase [Pseudarthrobacter sulfonivorans]ALV43685.1 amidohydrolase [Pseudarthrobacter sulfonivorans]
MTQAAASVTLAPGIKVSPDFVTEHIEMYKAFHRDPELSSHEHRTAAAIEARLDELGIEHFHSGGTGVVGLLRNGEGPVIAPRADTDGLPIAEETGLDYASTTTGTLPDGSTAPTMHGCGHDTHITNALAVAAYLTANREAWSGTVVFLFQPAEETAAGAKAMVDDGLWDRAPRPEVVLAQHVMPQPSGTFTLRPGHMASLADSWRITVRGRQAHGSQPEKSIDPIVAASAIVLRLQTIVSRELPPTTAAVVTVGTFHAGLKENIIPETAELSLNIRTPDEETRTKVLEAVRRIVNAEAAASGIGEPDIVEISRFPRLFNDAEHTERVAAAFREAFGEESIINAPLGMGSEDAGWLGDAIGAPVVFWAFGGFLAAEFEDGKAPAGNHHPAFAPDPEAALVHGTAAALSAVLSYVGR